MADLSMSFDPASVATNSDAASSALAEVASVSDAASDAVSKIGARTDQSVKSAASPEFVGIKKGTADGSDDSLLYIAGGGANGYTRGACINLYGNEHGVSPGCAEIFAGGITGGEIKIYTSAGGTERLNISLTGLVTVKKDLQVGQHIYFDAVQTATGDGTTTIDWGLGNKFYFTFGAQADTFTFTAPDGPCNLVLVLKQDGTGSREATWPESVMWPSGTAPTLSTGANDVDIVCFFL